MIEVLKQIQQCLKDKMYAHAEMYLSETIKELENQKSVDYEELAALGWQAIECGICGGSARGYPQRIEEKNNG
jgi:hypothetical protein